MAFSTEEAPHRSVAPMLKTLGFVRYVDIDAEARRVVVEFECRPDHCHSGNVAQGGFVTGWVDNAMATAAMVGAGEGRVAMSLDVKVSFFRAANPGPIFAEAWIEHGGGRTVFAEGFLRTVDGVKIAKATSTIALLKPRGD